MKSISIKADHFEMTKFEAMKGLGIDSLVELLAGKLSHRMSQEAVVKYFMDLSQKYHGAGARDLRQNMALTSPTAQQRGSDIVLAREASGPESKSQETHSSELGSISARVEATARDAGSIEEPPKYWAILVGINYYQTGRAHGRLLRGAIQDIEDVEKMLQSQLMGKRLQITKIAARAPEDPLFDPEAAAPNYETIVHGAFGRVKSQAKAGDFFYFHFSGYGGRQQRKGTGDDGARNAVYEMLVFDGDRHLPDSELGRLLDDIASRDVTTFAVLDCCHSGGADRAGNGVRGLEEILPPIFEDTNVESPTLQNYDYDNGNADEIANSRDVSTIEPFWVRAKDYTFLAACHPSEKAKEIPDQGRWRGVLTSGFLRALGQLAAAGGVQTYRVLYEIIRTGMIKEGYDQRCMLHGQRDRLVFCNQSLETTRVATVQDMDKYKLQFDMGEVHGVCLQEEYDIYPRNVEIDNGSSNNKLARMKIIRVEVTQSYAQRPEGDKSIKRGCFAKLVRPVIRHPLHVKVLDEKLLAPLRELLGEKPGPFDPTIHSASSAPDTAFQVLSKGSNYELADSTGTSLRHSPPIPAEGSEEAIRTLCKRLRRFARYRFVAELANKNQNLAKSFTFNVSPVEVFSGQQVAIKYANLTKGTKAQDLYFSLLVLTTRRDVNVIHSSIPISPGEAHLNEVMAWIPPDLDMEEIEDILMVIVTTEYVRFESLETPGLHVQDSGNQLVDELYEAAGAKQVENLLLKLNEGSQDAENSVISSWQTQQVIVRIKTGRAVY